MIVRGPQLCSRRRKPVKRPSVKKRQESERTVLDALVSALSKSARQQAQEALRFNAAIRLGDVEIREEARRDFEMASARVRALQFALRIARSASAGLNTTPYPHVLGGGRSGPITAPSQSGDGQQPALRAPRPVGSDPTLKPLSARKGDLKATGRRNRLAHPTSPAPPSYGSVT